MSRFIILSFIEISKKIKRFLIIGIIAVGIDYFIYSTLVAYEFSVSFSKLVGFIFGTSFSFAGNRRITFKSIFLKSMLFKYFLLYLFTMNLNVMLNNKFLDVFMSIELNKQISFIFATGFCAVINFFGLNYFVFKEKKI